MSYKTLVVLLLFSISCFVSGYLLSTLKAIPRGYYPLPVPSIICYLIGILVLAYVLVARLGK